MKKNTYFFISLFILILTSCENPLFVEASKLYTVSFETNGGTKIESIRTDKITECPQSQKEDASLVGWYISSDFSSSQIDFPLELNHNTTLYAKWVQKYQVYFETNGGTEIAEYKTSVIPEQPLTIKNDNLFLGWYTSPDFAGEKISFPYELTEVTIFYAKWGKLYSVEFEVNGGTSITSFRGTDIQKTPESSKEGYILKGWYLDSDFTKQVTFPYVLQSDCKLYAKWEARTDITYYVEHFKQDTNLVGYNLIETEVHKGSANSFTSVNAKTYTGYHAQDFEQQKISIDGKTTVQIYYDLNSYTITFNANGGSGNEYSQEFYYDIPQQLTSNKFTRTGYSFLGWSDQTTGSAKYTNNQQLRNKYPNNTQITLYAIWSYGSTVTANTVSSLNLASLTEPYTIKVTGSINQNTLVNLATKIATAKAAITLDLSGTNGLETIASSTDNTSIFINCSKLTSVILPDSLTTIGSYAFYNCSSLISIIIPKSVKTVGEYAFYKTGLKEITLNGIVTIGRNAFAYCTSLYKINMSNITTISDSTFNGCKSLASVTIDAKNIGYEAFYDCTVLTSVIFSKAVKKIGYYAFVSCNSLCSATFLDTNNWYRGTYLKDVTNPATNATLLKDGSCYSDWSKK